MQCTELVYLILGYEVFFNVRVPYVQTKYAGEYTSTISKSMNTNDIQDVRASTTYEMLFFQIVIQLKCVVVVVSFPFPPFQTHT